ncbi:AAA family ATPase [Mariniflexile ostreae]|uniref:AAA family ATPase n=1 Tax=Mariniflexile ostreae TaxID=1520892 RepID=A0ABV5FAP3_9FLAO
MGIKKIVITGGPGSGKSTLISALAKRGYACREEISRSITIKAKKEGIAQLFLTQPLLFSNLLLKGRLKQYTDAHLLNKEVVFLDRGLPDILAYMDYIGESYPSHYIEVCQAHVYDNVFMLKPWEAIYTTDTERYEGFDQALEIHDCLINTYQKHQYPLIDVPFDTVENRVDFILKSLNL